MIDKNELLKLLPKLIREDDEIKGAIISALSGVVATKEDIKELIREFDKRFEAMDKRFEATQKQMQDRFEAMDKRFEAMQKQMNDRFEAIQIQIETNYRELRSAIDNLGGRVGRSSEDMIIKLLHRYNKLKDFEISQIKQEELIDKDGIVFTKGYRTDIDILLDNGKTILIEIKFKADNRDMYHLIQVGRLYEKLYKKPDELWVITFEISPRNFEMAHQFPIKLIYGRIKE